MVLSPSRAAARPDEKPPCGLGFLGLDGSELYDIELSDDLKPRQTVEVTARKPGFSQEPGFSEVRFTTLCRIDSPVEIDYYRHGGILHKVLRDLATQ